MKRYITGILVLTILIVLTGCTSETIELPDFEGSPQSSIEIFFELKEIDIEIRLDNELENENLSGTFSSYGEGYLVGEDFPVKETLIVYVFEKYTNLLFSPIEFEYDGPYLNEEYALLDSLKGGSFDAPLSYCGDGDTAVFDYPTEVYDAILSSAKSVRFLNMDTEETFNGGEEEWGKPASVYTCDMLRAAEEVKVQTDPYSLLGNYGRLLGWVWVKFPGDEEFQLLNYMIVKQGLAQVRYEFGNGLDLEYDNHTYNAWMHIAEDFATKNDLGLWGNQLDYYWDYEEDEPNYSRWH